jgi:hypothetical protein
MTGSAPELNPPKSACAGDVVLRTSTRGTVPMRERVLFIGTQYSNLYTVVDTPTETAWFRDSTLGAIEDSISQCTFLQMTYTTETPHADGRASPGAGPRFRPPRHRDPHTTSPVPTTVVIVVVMFITCTDVM